MTQSVKDEAKFLDTRLDDETAAVLEKWNLVILGAALLHDADDRAPARQTVQRRRQLIVRALGDNHHGLLRARLQQGLHRPAHDGPPAQGAPLFRAACATA